MHDVSGLGEIQLAGLPERFRDFFLKLREFSPSLQCFAVQSERGYARADVVLVAIFLP
jgi:hypothetical protein